MDDLQLIANLGIRTLRYPVLWERIAPRASTERDWGWTDHRLQRLRTLSIDPIVGLLHHGSGPHYTGLLHSNFPTEFARFAGAVAQRYPWVTRYTPINEPLTTARFSGLYGFWYPHHRNARTFARAFINQCRAIVLGMKAIRDVNPAAQLVQTEDLGTTYGTLHMAYQKNFDNERRWLTWDILSGRVDRRHCLRPYLEDSGIFPEELDWFISNLCPPQVVGINHYVTSDRYLDERKQLYPPHSHGGNGREAYADMEAVRVIPGDYDGWKVIGAAAERYGWPVALTEVHIGCTREEQLRWFAEAHEAALTARRAGHDVRAVTAWALFGSYNWDTLLTQTNGTYEAGAFDVRAPLPRITAIGKLIKQCASDVEATRVDAPFGSGGWWQRSEKVLYGPRAVRPSRGSRVRSNSSKLVICGANGVLGKAFIEECKKRCLPYVGLTRADLENSDAVAVSRMLDGLRPWAVINAAGHVGVEQAERDVAKCHRDNVAGPRVLAAAADSRKIRFVTFSSDLVFDGRADSAYLESSLPAPLSIYGRSKLESEQATLAFPNTLCTRTAAFFGADNGGDFLTRGLMTLKEGSSYTAMNDVTVSPTYLPDLVAATLDLMIDGCVGLIHLVNQGAVTWCTFLHSGAAATGINVSTLDSASISELPLTARLPLNSALASERVYVMPTLDDAIARYAASFMRHRNVGKRSMHTA